jgi:predicted NBD/HSP70 family sugar kinase
MPMATAPARRFATAAPAATWGGPVARCLRLDTAGDDVRGYHDHLDETNTKPEMNRDPVGQRSETVRRANLSAIVRELHGRGPLSRSELVARTGLTRSAIRGLIGELVADDVVVEERPPLIGAPGRPSPVVRANPEGVVVLALEIAIDSLAIALVGLGGTVIEQLRVARRRGHFSVDETVADLAELSGRFRTLDRKRRVLAGIGVAMAGIVRRTDGLVANAPNLDWEDIPLGDRLSAALNLGVPITVANEADLGALAELRRGAGRGADEMIFISGEVGVGGGIIVGGRPLTGAAGFAGEVGHMTVNRDGALCHCGAIGCWETEVGERALLSLAGRAPEGGRDAVDAVIADAASGSPIALAAIETVGRWLGLGIGILVNILNPRLIVLGGLFGEIHPYMSGTLEAALDAVALEAPRRLVHVIPATLGMDAPLLGAAELAFEPFLSDPAAWFGPRIAERRVVA